MRLATAEEIQGRPAEMVFNNAVVGLEPEEGVLKLAGGEQVTADVVVGEY